jgi:ElaB/YqjD/DUF883 family membrane-anchored ribosome-binding protein
MSRIMERQMSTSSYSGDYSRNGREKIAAAGDELKRTASDVRDAAGEALSDVSDKAAEFRDKASAAASDAAAAVKERGREVMDKLPEMASTARTEIERSIKERPMATLAIAAGLAFVAGALWKR